MPFKSKAQRRWMYATHPEMAKRWEKHTSKGKKLPEHVKKAVARIAARVKTAEPPPPEGVSLEEWDRILQGKKPKDIIATAVKKAAAQGYLNQVIQEIKFPRREHEALRKRLAAGLPAFTTRIKRERGKYTPGQILRTPWGGRVQVTRITQGQGYTHHPFVDELSPGQRNAIRRHKYDLVEFHKIGGARIGPSMIQGQGLIANTGYDAGDIVGPAIDKVNLGGDLDQQHLQTALGRYVNHSSEPNTELIPLNEKQWGLRTLQEVAPGEELTVDYRTLPNVIPGLSVPIPGESLLENIKKAAYHLNIRKVLYVVNLTRRGS